MKREIKFRYWDAEAKRMIHWHEVKLLRFIQFIAFAEIHGSEVMQYTCLKDRNGKEIYEGDVYHHGDHRIKYIVEWHDTGLLGRQIGSLSYAGITHWQEVIEVIGNIYENPNLLQ